jgi:hypothetical protein
VTVPQQQESSGIIEHGHAGRRNEEQPVTDQVANIS